MPDQPTRPITLGCEDWKKVVGDFRCCVSCHEDWDNGYYDATWREYDDKYYEVCCRAPAEPKETP